MTDGIELVSKRMSRKRAALWVAATIAAPLVLVGITSWFYIGAWYARTQHQGSPTREILLESMLFAGPPALWASVGLWWLIHRRRAGFGELFQARAHHPWGDVAVGLALGVAWIVFYSLGDVVPWRTMLVLDRHKLASVPLSLSAGSCEELLDRGFLFWLIAAAGGKGWHKVVISSAAFGLGHVFWGPVGMIATTVLGLTFSLVVLWRGNVWPALIAHTLLNLAIEPGLIEKAFSGEFG